MANRRIWKRNARRSLKQHYWLWVVLCLLMMVLSGEQIFDTYMTPEHRAQNVRVSLSNYSDRMVELLIDLSDGKITQSREKTDQTMKDDIEHSNDASMFGRSRGVLSQVVNRVTSGSFLVSLTVGIGRIIGSDSIAAGILVVLGLLFSFGFWAVIINTYRVVMARMFLEGMNYPVVHTNRALYLLKTKTWLRASWTVFVTYVYRFLWDLTIVGGIIKRYSYYLVPYIVAENPNLRANEAISLSRKMMDGHKWECFCLNLSFLGWELLNLPTFGFLKLLFVRPYQTAADCEYYSYIRALRKKEHLPGMKRLPDEFLFQKPEQFVLDGIYEEVIDGQRVLDGRRIQIAPAKRFLAKNFGLVIRNDKAARALEERQIHDMTFALKREELCGTIYPTRLSPIPEGQQRDWIGRLNPLRCYSVWSIVMMFFLFSIGGWLWEVSYVLVTEGSFVNRGMLYGPWLPIYGVGGVLVLLLLYRFRYHPALEFFAAIVLSGVVEYMTSFVTSRVYHQMWWDYTGYFLNLNGRICAEGLLVFGIGGMAIVYFIAPVLDNLIRRIPSRLVIVISLALLCGFLVDEFHASAHPNAGAGITSVSAGTDPLKTET